MKAKRSDLLVFDVPYSKQYEKVLTGKDFFATAASLIKEALEKGLLFKVKEMWRKKDPETAQDNVSVEVDEGQHKSEEEAKLGTKETKVEPSEDSQVYDLNFGPSKMKEVPERENNPMSKEENHLHPLMAALVKVKDRAECSQNHSNGSKRPALNEAAKHGAKETKVEPSEDSPLYDLNFGSYGKRSLNSADSVSTAAAGNRDKKRMRPDGEEGAKKWQCEVYHVTHKGREKARVEMEAELAKEEEKATRSVIEEEAQLSSYIVKRLLEAAPEPERPKIVFDVS